jgi:hypothetical protein
MRRTVFAVSFLLLCPVWAALGQQSAISIQGGEVGQAAKKGEQGAQPLTNESILKLVKAGLGEDTIIKMVDTQPGKYSVGADDIIALKTAGVSEKIITAMLDKSASTPTPPPKGSAGDANKLDQSDRLGASQSLPAVIGNEPVPQPVLNSFRQFAQASMKGLDRQSSPKHAVVSENKSELCTSHGFQSRW